MPGLWAELLLGQQQEVDEHTFSCNNTFTTKSDLDKKISGIIASNAISGWIRMSGGAAEKCLGEPQDLQTPQGVPGEAGGLHRQASIQV